LYRQHEADEQSSLEMRFKGKRVGIFDYTVGAYGYRETVHAVTALTASSIASFLQPNYTTKSWAPFGRLTANLSDDLRLVGGVRYTDDRKTFVGPTIGGAVVCTAVVAGVPTCPNAVLFPLVDSPAQLPFAFPAVAGAPPALQIANGIPTGAIVARTTRADNTSLKNNKVTYRAAVEYDISSKSLFYASYETGYRSGGFSPAQGFETFQPEYITAYTVGLKNRFLDNRIQLNLEIFDWEYKNQQVNHVGLDLSGRTANFTQNIGRSRIKGAEVEARALVTPSTLLSADVQYLDTEDIDFVYQAAVGTPGTPPPLTGCAVSLNANPTLYNINCAGKPSYNSPELTINLAAQQTILIQNSKIVIGADTQYKSRQAVGFTYLAEQYAAANWRSNAQIQFGPATDAWSIAAYVRNIEDNRTIVASGLHPSSNVLVAGTTPPLTYGVRLSAKF
jgi:iron complex outermembrane receptor protein